ncbi:MAG: hypothetical protein K2H45_04080 [Acetatifactor sp.]|nr:hypothetical protein [Acetatifactor sp.]
MKKSLLFSLFILVLAVFSLPAALVTVDSGKEKILISEEVLSGDPMEAAGITLKIPSHWGRQLLWVTEYTIGSGKEAESRFYFSAKPVYWGAADENAYAYLRFEIGADFQAAYAENSTALNWNNDICSTIISEVAERAEIGKGYTETIRIGDYSPYFPLSFEIEGHSVQYEGDYNEACDYLREYFHISSAEDKMEVTVELNGQGNVTNASARFIGSDENISIVNAAADDGEEGLYYVYCLENTETGEWADRDQNMGIFYFPYQEQESWWYVDLTQVKKLCDYPGSVIPLQMLIDNEEKILYLAVREQEDYSLLVYQLEEKIPVLMQQIPVNRDGLPKILPNAEESTDRPEQPSFCRMSLEDGGILMTWEDNAFSFIARENGQYRCWCSGVFPGAPFPKEQVCIFNGEKLILAAYESWDSTNVLLSVYDEQGQTYSGRYVHSGQEDVDMCYYSLRRIATQGNRPESPQYSASVGIKNEIVEPLELFFTPDYE